MEHKRKLTKRMIAASFALSLAVSSFGCSKGGSSDSEELVPPVPAEASDPNTVTFDDGNFVFAEVITDDKVCAEGKLSVEEVKGNKMLKFADDLSVPMEGKVQKIEINAAALLGLDNISKVRSIEFDVYADALAENYVNRDGERVQVPGTISCGGGTVTAKLDANGQNKWYDFAKFEGGEYNFDFSGPIHGEFKFLLADSGEHWDDTMYDANFLIMRWGSENDSNFYIDNIVFYDENNKSIPLRSDPQPITTSAPASEPITTEQFSTEPASAETVTKAPVTVDIPTVSIDIDGLNENISKAKVKASEAQQQLNEALTEASRMIDEANSKKSN